MVAAVELAEELQVMRLGVAAASQTETLCELQLCANNEPAIALQLVIDERDEAVNETMAAEAAAEEMEADGLERARQVIGAILSDGSL